MSDAVEARSPRFRTLLLAGAAGGLGRVLRPYLRGLCTTLRVSDLRDPGPSNAGEEVVACDLADRAAVARLVRGVDAIVHFGGVAVEDRFDSILQANLLGTFNVYEAARQFRVKRIVYASSGQVTGFYPQSEIVDATMPPRPSSLYAVSKTFGESLSRCFYDRYGIETVCLRIAMCFPEPTTRRMLKSYLSYGDLCELVRCALTARAVGHEIVYGVSANRDTLWRNPGAQRIGFVARDSSEPFRAAVEANDPNPDPNDPQNRYHGGRFTRDGPFEEALT